MEARQAWWGPGPWETWNCGRQAEPLVRAPDERAPVVADCDNAGPWWRQCMCARTFWCVRLEMRMTRSLRADVGCAPACWRGHCVLTLAKVLTLFIFILIYRTFILIFNLVVHFVVVLASVHTLGLLALPLSTSLSLPMCNDAEEADDTGTFGRLGQGHGSIGKPLTITHCCSIESLTLIACPDAHTILASVYKCPWYDRLTVLARFVSNLGLAHKHTNSQKFSKTWAQNIVTRK